jgi:hypothetical protein
LVSPATILTGGGELPTGVSNVGRINQDYPANEWRITSGAGQVTIEVQGIQGDFLPVVSVFDANGLLIAEATADESGNVNLVAEMPAEGRYNIVVSSVDENAAGDYTIAFMPG